MIFQQLKVPSPPFTGLDGRIPVALRLRSTKAPVTEHRLEIAFLNGWIGPDDLMALGDALKNTDYGEYLIGLAKGVSFD